MIEDKAKETLDYYTSPLTTSSSGESSKKTIDPDKLAAIKGIQLKKLEDSYKERKLKSTMKLVEDFINIFYREEHTKVASRRFLILLVSAVLLIQNGLTFYLLYKTLENFQTFSSDQVSGLVSIFSIITTATLLETYLILRKITEYLFKNNYDRQLYFLEKLLFSDEKDRSS